MNSNETAKNWDYTQEGYEAFGDWGTDYYPEFTAKQKVYVPKSKETAYKNSWKNFAEQISYKIPLPQIKTTFGTISREFDVDLSDRTDNTQLLSIDDMPVVAFTGKVKDFKNGDEYLGIRMLSINCEAGKSIQTGQTNLGDGTYIPANTGVLLKSYAADGKSDANAYYRIGEKSHDYSGDFDTETTYTNVFQPVVENSLKITYTDGDYYNYLISGGGYKDVNHTSGNTMTVHKAYIHVNPGIGNTSASPVKGLMFIWDAEDDATSISNVNADAENGEKVIYDLSGRRVNNANAKGLYIVNGKKMMVK